MGHAPREAAGWEGLSLEYAGAAETWKHAVKFLRMPVLYKWEGHLSACIYRSPSG